MVKKYELPDEMLQLIGGAPELDFGMQQQSGAAQFATPGVRRSDLISALRNISGPANPGFTRYANQANGAALSPTARKTLNVISPARLTLSKYIAPDVVLPGGEPPYVPPYVPPVIPPFVDPIDPFDPEVLDPEVLDPEVLDPEVLDPKVLDPDPLDPTVLDPEPDDPEVPEPSIRTKIIESDIPDEIDPNSIPLIIPEFPIDLPEIPEVPEKDDRSFFDDLDFVEVGPSRGLQKNPEDLPEEFDQYLVDEILNSLTGGGGKSVFDETLGSLEF